MSGLNRWYNVVEDYGVKNKLGYLQPSPTNDVTLNSQLDKIHQAINDASNNDGGTIYFPPGYYQLRNPIILQSNIEIVADNATQIHLEENAKPLLKCVNLANVKISGGSWTSKHPAPTFTDGNNGIHVENSSNLVVQNISMKDFGAKGILVFGSSSDIRIINNYFESIAGEAININDQAIRVIASQNNIRNVGGDGILIKGNHCSVIANTLHDIGNGNLAGSGIAIGTDNFQTTQNLVQGNVVVNSHAYGIINDKSSYSIITNNIVDYPNLDQVRGGIKIGAGGKSSIISSNMIKNIGNVSNGVITVDGPDCIIISNFINNYSGDAISGPYAQSVGTIVENNRTIP